MFTFVQAGNLSRQIFSLNFVHHLSVASANHTLLFTQVMSVKALGIALKLTLQGQNQLIYPQTSVFAMVVFTCVLTQMNYLNKVRNEPKDS